MATRGGASAKGRTDSRSVSDASICSRAVGNMDKLIYKLIVGLACLILAIVLIAAPVLTKMFIEMDRRDKRMAELEKRLQKKIEQIEQPELPKGE
jgi:hypothetical protein